MKLFERILMPTKVIKTLEAATDQKMENKKLQQQFNPKVNEFLLGDFRLKYKNSTKLIVDGYRNNIFTFAVN